MPAKIFKGKYHKRYIDGKAHTADGQHIPDIVQYNGNTGDTSGGNIGRLCKGDDTHGKYDRPYDVRRKVQCRFTQMSFFQCFIQCIPPYALCTVTIQDVTDMTAELLHEPYSAPIMS